MRECVRAGRCFGFSALCPLGQDCFVSQCTHSPTSTFTSTCMYVDLCNYFAVHLRIIVSIHPDSHADLCIYFVVQFFCGPPQNNCPQSLSNKYLMQLKSTLQQVLFWCYIHTYMYMHVCMFITYNCQQIYIVSACAPVLES